MVERSELVGGDSKSADRETVIAAASRSFILTGELSPTKFDAYP